MIPGLVQLVSCHICLTDLTSHPLYDKTVAMTCKDHGDFFIQRLRGKRPEIVFRSFQEYDGKVKKKPQSKRPRSVRTTSPRPIIARVQTRSGNPGIIVRCDQTGEIFPTVKSAAEKLGISKHRMSTHLSGRQRHVSGYTFTIMDDMTPDPNYVPIPMQYFGRTRNPPVKIRCEQTGQIFESMRAAAKTLDLNWAGLYRHLRNPAKYPRVKGYVFSKLD